MGEVSGKSAAPVADDRDQMHALYRRGGQERAMAPHIVYQQAGCPHKGCGVGAPMQAIDFRLEDHGRSVHDLGSRLVERYGVRRTLPAVRRADPLHHPFEASHHADEADQYPQLPGNWHVRATILLSECLRIRSADPPAPACDLRLTGRAEGLRIEVLARRVGRQGTLLEGISGDAIIDQRTNPVPRAGPGGRRSCWRRECCGGRSGSWGRPRRGCGGRHVSRRRCPRGPGAGYLGDRGGGRVHRGGLQGGRAQAGAGARRVFSAVHAQRQPDVSGPSWP